jgi:hypothetical protein
MDLNEFLYFIVGGIIFLVSQYLIYYFREKGKNLATKEDVEEITDKIEAVKNQYTVEIEKLKADLQLAIGSKNMLIEKRNEALIKFFEDTMVLYHEKLSRNPADLPMDMGKSLIKYQSSTEHLFTEIYSDYYRLLLYPMDKQIQVAAGNLVNSIVEVRKIFTKHFSNVKIRLAEENLAWSEGKISNIEQIMKNTDIAGKNYHEQINPAIETLSKAFTEYLSALNNHFKHMDIETALDLIEKD